MRAVKWCTDRPDVKQERFSSFNQTVVDDDDVVVDDGDEFNSSYDTPWRLLGDVRNDRRSFPANCTSFLSPIAFTNLLLANSALSYDMLLLLLCCGVLFVLTQLLLPLFLPLLIPPSPTLQVRFGNLPLLEVTSSQAGVSATGTKQGTSRRILA